MLPDLDGLSAANPAYLHALAERVVARTAAPAVEDIVPFKKSDTRKVVVILPGSFTNVRYLSDFAAGLSSLDAEVLGVNYPGHSPETRIVSLDSLHLTDYSAAVYAYLLSLKDRYDQVCLVGHSLGTILVQLSVFLDYAFSRAGNEKFVVPIRKIAILGGGPPRPSWLDYGISLFAKLPTMTTVMQMVNNPKRFISEKGDMRGIFGDDFLFDDLVRRKLVYIESKAVMKEAFLNSGHCFIPAKIITDNNIKTLFAYAINDYFVSPHSSRKAVEQWAATPLVLSVGHSGMVLGDAGRKLGAACSDFFL